MKVEEIMALADAYSYASRQAKDRDSHTRAALHAALTAQADRTAWLIELNIGGQTHWIAEYTGDNWFTNDANSAIQFPTKQSALGVLDYLFTLPRKHTALGHTRNHYSVTEHVFMGAALTAQADELEAQRNAKDGAYWERNNLVALLSKVFPAGKKKTAIEGWTEDWRSCVYIDLPTGQASWHYHDSQAHLFDHLPEYQGEWDGHTTGEKYERLAGYQATAQADRVKELEAKCADFSAGHCTSHQYKAKLAALAVICDKRHDDTYSCGLLVKTIRSEILAVSAQPKTGD